MKKSIFAKMFTVAAFAAALPMMAIDVEKELAPMIPEGTDVLVGVDFPAILDAPITKKYLPDALKAAQEQALTQGIPCASADCIEKMDKALASQNLTRADFKDVFILVNTEKSTGSAVLFTKATLANMKAMNEALAPAGKKLEYKDATVAGFQAITCVEKGEIFVLAQVKPGVLVVGNEDAIKTFANKKKISASSPIIQKFPKKDFLLKFVAVPEKKDPSDPQMVTGCVIANGENIDIKAKLGFASADSAKEICNQANMQIGMLTGFLAMQEPKFAELVQKSLKIEPAASDMQIAVSISPALIEAIKEFQAKQAAAQGGMNAPGVEIDEAEFEEVEE